MKLSTLIARIVKNTGRPDLAGVLAGKLAKNSLGDACIPWDGTKHSVQAKRRISRHKYGVRLTVDKPRAIIHYNGKRHQVPRLMHQIIHKPDYEFRLQQICGTPGCVNPNHWAEIRVKAREFVPDDVPDFSFDPVGVEEWNMKETEEMMEILFTEYYPKTWDDVVNAPLLEGAPEDMICAILTRWHKHHLLPKP